MQYKFNISESYISAFFSAMLFFMYLGRALFYIHFAVVTLMFIFFCLKKSISGKQSTSVIYVLVYFVLTLIINIIPTEFSFLDNLGKNIDVALMTLMSCYFSDYLFFRSKNSEANKQYALKYFFYSTSILSIIIILSYVSDINLIQSVAKLKLVGFNQAMYHASQNFLALGSSFLLYYYSKNKTCLNAVLLLFFLLATLASHGRTAIITTVVSWMVYLYISSAGKRSLSVGLSMAALSVAALVSVSYISSGGMLAVSKINTSGRIEGSIQYVNYVLENSPYWGLGIDGPRYLRDQGVVVYGSPHNIFLEAFVTLGFWGLGVFVCFVLLLSNRVRQLFLLNPDPHKRALVVSVLIAWLIDGQSFLSIWAKPNMTLVFFYLFLALCIAKGPVVTDVQQRSFADRFSG